MIYDANKKSIAISYVLWIFLWCFGGHRFYNNRTGSAIAQLLLTIFGLILSSVGIGVFPIIAVAIWAVVDAFLIPEWIRAYNNRLISELERA